MVLASQIDFCQAENNDDAINLRCFEKNVLKKKLIKLIELGGCTWNGCNSKVIRDTDLEF